MGLIVTHLLLQQFCWQLSLLWMFRCVVAISWIGALNKMFGVSSLYVMIERVIHSIFLSTLVNTTHQPEIRTAAVHSIDVAQ